MRRGVTRALSPRRRLIGQPSYLWDDQNGLHGLGQDAFGIWRFPC